MMGDDTVMFCPIRMRARAVIETGSGNPGLGVNFFRILSDFGLDGRGGLDPATMVKHKAKMQDSCQGYV